MAETPDVKKLGLKKLLEDNDVGKFLEVQNEIEKIATYKTLSKQFSPFSKLADMMVGNLDGEFMAAAYERINDTIKGMAKDVNDAIKEDFAEHNKKITALVEEKDATTRQALIRDLESGLADVQKRVTQMAIDRVEDAVNTVLPQITADARLTEAELQDLKDEVALSVESQIDGLVGEYIKDQGIDANQINDLKAYIQSQIPEVDFSKAVIDWRQIKNVPNLSGGGAGARTLYWLNDVDFSTAPTNGQVLMYNATTQKWYPATAAGTGDMTKAVYDADDDGVVDEAAAVEGVGAAGNSKYYGTNGAGAAGFYDLPSGASVADGDKGDITVSGSGATWTIDNSAVTYAKMQNVSATDRLLGRDTAGAGVVEELTPAAVRTMINVADGATANSADATLLARANHTGTQTASTISDFDTEVSNNTDVAANTAARHDAVTVADSAEIDLTLTGQQISASIVAGSIDETKLDASTNASLDLADSALQNVVEDTTPQLGGDLDAQDNDITGVGAVRFTQQLDNGSKTASFSVDFATDQHQKVTLTANTMTLTLDTTSIGVGVYTLEIVNGGLATLTWASETGSITWAGGAAPTLTSSGTDVVSLLWTGSLWRGQASLAFA